MKLILILFLASSVLALSQYIEDGDKYSSENTGKSPRQVALGLSFYGISDDVTTLQNNPAGLTFIKKSEFSLGIGSQFRINSFDKFGNSYSQNNSTQYLQNFAGAKPYRAFR